jgi:ubiquinone/menaquinone biosynthesis C-methylase UbiE
MRPHAGAIPSCRRLQGPRKDYLRRLGSGDWDRLKPFSPPGADTLEESVTLFQDFAAAIAHLPPAPGDLVLDLGAGACWCSDWLQRLNRRTVAVDISCDMLRLGRTRLPHPDRALLTAGDFEALPFAAGTFDKAYCLSAIHHVPDIERALAEIHRVLSPRGAVLFSEPGVGHAEKPGSVLAMRDFGVLEQDIHASRFMEMCRRVGFVDVRLRPLSYLNGSFDLTPDQFESWQALADSKRPVRALQKRWRTVLELVGAGKRDVLFEEALMMTFMRLLRHAMAEHPLIVASKTPLSPPALSRYRSRVRVLAAPARVAPGEWVALRLQLVNTGTLTWHATAGPEGRLVRLGVQLLDGDIRLVDREFHREPLQRAVLPGASATVDVRCQAPAVPGTYHLKLDLVVEGLTWMEPHGGEVAIHRLEVAAREG